MKKSVHAVFFLAPIAILAGPIFKSDRSGATIDAGYAALAAARWSSPGGELRAEASKTQSGEVERVWVRSTGAGGGVVHEETFAIDHDYGGTGFVEPYQADADPELEILFASDYRAANHYLDLAGGAVTSIALESATPELRADVDRRLNERTSPFSMAYVLLLAVPNFFAYGIYFSVRLLKWLWRRGMGRT